MNQESCILYTLEKGKQERTWSKYVDHTVSMAGRLRLAGEGDAALARTPLPSNDHQN